MTFLDRAGEYAREPYRQCGPDCRYLWSGLDDASGREHDNCPPASCSCTASPIIHVYSPEIACPGDGPVQEGAP